ncbi:Dyp-type peroxidase [Streptomyces sp. NPDC088350]|uniref:Dyp-type peroxidase n=1 Tax=Streptomyces sp. NPDC088350 TaxID=3365854 RepID=UPI00381789E7
MATNAGFDTPDVPARTGLARRHVLAAALLPPAVTAAGCTRDDPAPGRRGPAFEGARQAGVTTPQQAAVLVMAYDLHAGLRGAAGARALRGVLRRWRRAVPQAPDPGAHLTATVAVGPRLPGRLGLPAPAGLDELPPFPGDRLDPARCGGDLLLQVCADDARSAAGAAAELSRLAGDVLRPRWRQAGFLPPTPDGSTPRNLLGFKDGTGNPTPDECERWVWSQDATFLVVRRVRLRVEAFARLAAHRQEEVIGRRRADGAPLGGGREGDHVDIFAKTPQGRYVTPLRSHVHAASPRFDAGARMLRRGYSYDDGPGDRGLLFLAFMRDPALFVRVQQRLAVRDDLSRFTEHRGSAVAYVLPGAGSHADPGAPLLA